MEPPFPSTEEDWAREFGQGERTPAVPLGKSRYPSSVAPWCSDGDRHGCGARGGEGRAEVPQREGGGEAMRRGLVDMCVQTPLYIDWGKMKEVSKGFSWVILGCSDLDVLCTDS